MKTFGMNLCGDSSGEEIENRLTNHPRGGRCAQKPAVRAVVENRAPLQVFDGGMVRHRIEHRAQPFIFEGKLLRPVLGIGQLPFRAWLTWPGLAWLERSYRPA